MEEQKQSLSQKILLGTIYSLLVLMIIFSILSLQNTGEQGYKKCIEKKCTTKGQEFCTKQREVNNCCQGTGGNLAVMNNQLSCSFN